VWAAPDAVGGQRVPGSAVSTIVPKHPQEISMTRLLSLATFVLVGLLACTLALGDETKKETKVPPTLNFTMKSLDGQDVNLAQYQGKVVLLVNTASKCGFTKQYKDLEEVYSKYKDKGLVVLGFPANNFRNQEPGSDKEIAQFCTQNYGVTFPMFSKISVVGDDKAPLYKVLTDSAQTTTQETGEVKWNFEKFLIGKDGKVVGRYRSRTTPTDGVVIKTIEAELAK
jgi:glutathione peroxidase